MTGKRIQTHLLSSMLAALLVTSTTLVAAEEASDSFDLATVTCWDFTGIEVEERVPALMMLYGYVVGKHGLSVQNAAYIAPALERVGKLCESNPDMYVASAIERVINDSDSGE